MSRTKAQPLPSHPLDLWSLPTGRKKGRGRGGVCNILSVRKILTPPQPLPYKGLLFIHIF